MKKLSLTLFFTLICSFGFAQIKVIDSLKNELRIAKQDTSRVIFLGQLSREFANSNPDTSLILGQKALDLAQKIKFLSGEVSTLNRLGITYRIIGDLPKAIDLILKGLKIAEDNHFQLESARCLNSLGLLHTDLEDYKKAKFYLERAYEVNKLVSNSSAKKSMNFVILSNLGSLYKNTNQLDSASYYFQKSLEIQSWTNRNVSSYASSDFARVEFLLGNHQKAMNYSHEAIQISKKDNNHRDAARAYHTIAINFKDLIQSDSAIFYAKLGLSESQMIGYKEGILRNSKLLTELYEPKDIKQAYHYQKIATQINEEIYGVKKIQALQKNILEDQERQREIEAKNIAFQNNLKLYGSLAGLSVLALVSFILFRNNRQKLKANALLQEKNEEINLQKDKAEKALVQLKSTQAQLIQSEKLASLGELTAGIAHEIQNPLNFVNNFSELSVDLAKDLNEEIEKPEIDKEYVKELMGDLTQNQEKINLHGKRASSIVSGMLEHSRASTGERVLTDINKLADESLRLSYHGLRAKDKNSTTDRFNSDFKTELDENLPKINVIPQDIGRVLLNLINNAFWAVNERSKKGETGFEPKVTVTTKFTLPTGEGKGGVEIEIADNGTGMSEATKAKIFQPFFTTKPTGQGTGLGLSLAYDIVTKGHGGTLEVETKEGEGTTFVVRLPI